MSDDLVARLRHLAEFREDACGSDFTEAADEIERLRAELAAERHAKEFIQSELKQSTDRVVRLASNCEAAQRERDELRALVRRQQAIIKSLAGPDAATPDTALKGDDRE